MRIAQWLGLSMKLYAITGIDLSLERVDSKVGLDDKWPLAVVYIRKSGQVMVIIDTPTMTR